MRCPSCGQEILLAERCPYCREPVDVPGSGVEREGPRQAAASDATGRFVGPLSGGPSAEAQEAGRASGRRLSIVEWVWRLVHYVMDPGVSAWKRGLVAAGLLYVLFPLDLLPSLVLPGIGWLDDLAVIWLGLSLLQRELAAYVPARRRSR